MAKTVLLIDSQMAARRMLRFAMELHEYRVVEFENQTDVLAVPDGSSPELLILGVNASDVGQHALVGRLRQQPALHALPVLLVGEDLLQSGWDLRTLGHCAWLNKPFHIGELQSKVASLLDYAPPPRPRQVQKASATQHG